MIVDSLFWLLFDEWMSHRRERARARRRRQPERVTAGRRARLTLVQEVQR